MTDLRVKGSLVIPSSELVFTAARSGGPGGQHVNTTSSKVILRYAFLASETFGPGQKQLLREKVPRRFQTEAGEILITSQVHRDQLRNKEACRAKLVETLCEALRRPKRRVKTKPTRGSKTRRKGDKQHQSRKKKERSRRDFD